jgi:lysophospholipase L1-like esterase
VLRLPAPRRVVSALALLSSVSLISLGLAGPSDARPAETTPAVRHTPAAAKAKAKAPRGYLALGDSIPFAYREATNLPTPDYTNPASFVGYPQLVASALHLKLVDAACPGETTASFMTPGAASNGCENTFGGQPGYRSLYPLHTRYSGTQLAFAVKYLKKHAGRVGLVTLQLGANDGFLCVKATTDHCASELGTLLAAVETNVSKILRTIRKNARYDGRIVLVNYYALDYADPLQSYQSQALNSALASAAQRYDADVADAYTSYARAASQSSGSSCAAGLLTILTGGGCGVHPSFAGHAVLANAVERQVRR